jgi:probable dihydroxyacetone kinase regulator
MSQSTKLALAQSLKQLRAEKTLDKITVKEIVGLCGVNRQTFYYHFRDIYDLLDWMFINEGVEFSRRFPDYHSNDDGESAIRNMCAYLIENRKVTMNIYNSLGRDLLGQYLTREMSKLLHMMLMYRALAVGASEYDVQLLVDFYKHAIVGTILDWVDNGLEGDVETIVRKYLPLLRGTFDDTLRRMTTQ